MPPDPPKRLQLTARMLFLLCIHVVLDLFLISRSWYWTQTALIIVMAIPLCQLSLLTIWAGVVTNNPVLRLAVPILGIVSCWILMSRILPWGTGDPATAGWAVALLSQAATILVALGCFFYISRRASNDCPHTAATTFGVGTLMLWTTASALALGFVQFGRHHWQWTSSVFQWSLLSAMPIIGIINGLVAALWLWALRANGLVSLAVRIAASLQMTGGLALLGYYATTWITGNPVLDQGSFLLVICSQSIIISLSLAVAMPCYKICADATDA